MIHERFRFLEHTADVKFEAFGGTKEELFENCARAMTAVMTDDEVGHIRRKEIRIGAKRDESLLFDFLSVLLFLLESEKLIVAAVPEIRIEDNRLIATLAGDDVQKYDVDGSEIGRASCRERVYTKV